MNCDFVETEYFYHQLGSQGETEEKDDSPSCLSPTHPPPPTSSHEPIPDPMPSHELDVSPTEEVNSTTEPPSGSHVQSEMIGDSPTLSSTSSNPGVSSSNVSPVHATNNMRQEDEEPGSEGETSREDDDQRVDPDTGQYELPPRSTRGIPPKRYSPDWQGRKSRYPVAYTITGQLTEMARAFEAALYEDEEIPQSVEEAMRHKHWRVAMQKEMEALIKNKTWEKHIIPEGKRPVGCRWVFTIKHRADGSI